jgi:hypothetical protein
MFDYFNWRREIADVMFAITQLVDHVADAEKIGGFELTCALLKRVGRNHRDHETADERAVITTMPLPKHDFDVAISNVRDVGCHLTITGLRRYAGFLLFCALPARRLLADLHSDPAHGVSWRARKLFEAIRVEQRVAARCSAGPHQVQPQDPHSAAP